jgi:hypothetical protein
LFREKGCKRKILRNEQKNARDRTTCRSLVRLIQHFQHFVHGSPKVTGFGVEDARTAFSGAAAAEKPTIETRSFWDRDAAVRRAAQWRQWGNKRRSAGRIGVQNYIIAAAAPVVRAFQIDNFADNYFSPSENAPFQSAGT